MATWTSVYWSSVRSRDIHLSASLQAMIQPSITEISLKFIDLQFYPNLPGANELNKSNFHSILLPLMLGRLQPHSWLYYYQIPHQITIYVQGVFLNKWILSLLWKKLWSLWKVSCKNVAIGNLIANYFQNSNIFTICTIIFLFSQFMCTMLSTRKFSF